MIRIEKEGDVYVAHCKSGGKTLIAEDQCKFLLYNFCCAWIDSPVTVRGQAKEL